MKEDNLRINKSVFKKYYSI